jgi:hypothetical protein
MFHGYKIVNEYACRHLTIQDDRFPALSGLARATGQRTKFTYRCGIWLEDMHRGLLWSTKGADKSNLRKFENICALSWTWVSINFAGNTHKHLVPYFPLVFQTIFPACDAKIVHCHVEMADDDPYGRISSAVLTIQGQCRAVNQRHEGELTPTYTHRNDWLACYTTPRKIFCEMDEKDDKNLQNQCGDGGIYL